MEIEMTSQKNPSHDISVPDGWKIVKIGDHFNFKNGLNKAKEFFGKGTPIVNYMDVYPFPGIYAANIHGKVTVSNDELRTFEVRKGDVLFTRTSETIEEIGLSSTILDDVKNTVFSGFLLRARSTTKLFTLQFKKYCFRSHDARKQIISSSSQTTRALTNGRFLSRVSILIPKNPDEQNAISGSISNVEKLIEYLNQLVSKKKNIRKGVIQELLTGKKRLPGFSDKWVKKEIGTFTKPFSGGTPSTQIKEYWGGDIRWMNSGELNNKKIFDVEGRITEFGLNNSSTQQIPEKCVLIGLAGQGKTRGIAAINYVTLCVNQSIAAIPPNKNFDPEFLYYNLDSRYDELRSMSSGVGGRGSLNLGIIKKIAIHMPRNIEEQVAISKIVVEIDTEIDNILKIKKKYLKIKNGMMQKLLTGEIRIQ